MTPEDLVFERSLHTFDLLCSHLKDCKQREKQSLVENLHLFESLNRNHCFEKDIRWCRRVIDLCNRELRYVMERNLE